MASALALLLLLVSATVCLATGRWWLINRRRHGYNWNDRKVAISLAGVAVIGIASAVQLLTKRSRVPTVVGAGWWA